MSRLQDLTGLTVGRLTVKSRAPDRIQPSGKHKVMWWCKCSCGNPELKAIEAYSLTHKLTLSCGCLNREAVIMATKKYNTYDLSMEYGIGWTSNTNEEFYFDLENYESIKDYCWFANTAGYIYAIIDGKHIALHRLIMEVNDSTVYIDHINHNKKDNRKTNLRYADTSKNQMNKKTMNNNTSGVAGVYWEEKLNKWHAQIVYNKKTYNLGRYDNFEDAVKARKEAEEKYFGDFSYEKSQAM